MSEMLDREERLIGKSAVDKLKKSHVAIFGIGGVGGYAVEALARSGIGELSLYDHDTISESNLNRQIIALRSTIGQYKVDVMKARIEDINPEAIVHANKMFFLPENKDEIDFAKYDYVIDAIDTVSGKIALIECCKQANVPIISAMGAGNKLDATAFEVADISKTSVCPLAKVMRRELKARGITSCKVVYSKEPPRKPPEIDEEIDINVLNNCDMGNKYPDLQEDNNKKRTKIAPGSNAYVPATAGLILAGEVIKDLSVTL